jgi:hypothetical protein
MKKAYAAPTLARHGNLVARTLGTIAGDTTENLVPNKTQTNDGD